MQLIDIGANLTHESFDYDRDAVLQRAYEAGVVQMVVTGSNRTHSSLALLLAQRHPGLLYATAGYIRIVLLNIPMNATQNCGCCMHIRK